MATGAVRPLEFVVVEWLVAAAGLLWVARIWLEPRRNRLLFRPVGECLLLVLGYALFHYLRSDVEYTARTEVLRLLVYALLFFVVLNNLHKSDWTQLALYVLVFTGVAIAIYGIVQVITGADHVWHFTRPEQGVEPHPQEHREGEKQGGEVWPSECPRDRGEKHPDDDVLRQRAARPC